MKENIFNLTEFKSNTAKRIMAEKWKNFANKENKTIAKQKEKKPIDKLFEMLIK